MANTTVMDGKFLSVDLDGATDWDLTTVLQREVSAGGAGIKVKSISVYAASTAIIICRNAKVADQTSPKIFHFVASTGELCLQYTFEGGAWMFPAFHATDCGAGVVCFELV